MVTRVPAWVLPLFEAGQPAPWEVLPNIWAWVLEHRVWERHGKGRLYVTVAVGPRSTLLGEEFLPWGLDEVVTLYWDLEHLRWFPKHRGVLPGLVCLHFEREVPMPGPVGPGLVAASSSEV